jgi:hypothetical protein
MSIDSIGCRTTINVAYPLKDVPAKLTVDGRRNLIAVVSRNQRPDTYATD